MRFVAFEQNVPCLAVVLLLMVVTTYHHWLVEQIVDEMPVCYRVSSEEKWKCQKCGWHTDWHLNRR